MEATANLWEISKDLIYRPQFDFTVEHLEGKVYVVTGASSGIGVESAKLLVSGGAKVWLLGRTESRMKKTMELIKEEYPQALLEFCLVEYENLSTIKPVAQRILAVESRLDGIIHNAGINWAGSEMTSLGLEKIIVVNCLAGFLLQRFLDPLMEKTANTSPPNSVRIIWVASSAHYFSPKSGGVQWEDLNNVSNGLLGFGIYGQTKAINIYQAVNWPKQHPDSKIISLAVHPGMIKSDIRRNNLSREDMMHRLCRPTIFGGYAEVVPLLDPKITLQDTGSYYRPPSVLGRVRPDVARAAAGEPGQKLWDWCTLETDPFF